MKKDIPTRQVHWLQTINKTNRRYARKKAEAHNQALQTIIDRYQAELNQDPVHDFFTAPEEVQRPVYERALQKAQEEQEKITNNQTL